MTNIPALTLFFRTISDLAAFEKISHAHVAEAIQYRRTLREIKVATNGNE
ncbi:MAG: hypothetical protein Q7R66_09545 [Undibacterium sp.]|nr:hypothetical protein [Undibacterium sp.]MDO8652420.1 hypothetical protein [Undibacterium sp.]